MSVILAILGVLLAAAGVAAGGYGLFFNDLSYAASLFLAGSFGLVGGLLLIGLAAVVGELKRVSAGLRIAQAAPARPARVELVPPAPEPVVAREAVPAQPQSIQPQSIQPQPVPQQSAPSPSLEVSATAIERLRSSIPRSERPVPEAEEVPLQHGHPGEPRAEPVPRPVGAAVVETREPRFDLLLRSRPAKSGSQHEPFEALWPRRSGREPQPEPRLEVAAPVPSAPSPALAMTPPSGLVMNGEPTRHVYVEAELESPAASRDEPPPERSVAILKSGVVDGMAYTLYADGSIEAQLPQGTVRFGSIAELRAHIENNS